MSAYLDCKAIAHGFDASLVECVGGKVLLDLEAMDEGANLQALKLTLSDPMKDAKNNMKAAKKAAKNGNYAVAKQLYKAAIKDLEVLKKRAQDIDDDHLVMVALDAFIKTFIPMFIGVLVSLQLPGFIGVLGQLGSYIGAYICGTSKSLDYAAAIEKKSTDQNKQGKGGSYDPSVWWKVGETRGAVMTKLDRLITACEKGIEFADRNSKKF